jgi:CBS domain-containing protein
MMRTTIMTEKIKRKGIQMPEDYRADMLELTRVSDISKPVDSSSSHFTSHLRSIEDLLGMIKPGSPGYDRQSMIIVLDQKQPVGIVFKEKLHNAKDKLQTVTTVMEEKVFTVYPDNSLALALEIMLKSKQELLPVVERGTGSLIGIVTDWDILQVFEKRFVEDGQIAQHISIRKKAITLMRKVKRKSTN